MEGQSSHENTLQFPSLEFNTKVNDVSHLTENESNQQYVMVSGEGVNEIDTPLLPWLIQAAKPPSNYVEFLAEGSTFPLKASTKDMVESFPNSIIDAVNGVSGIYGDISYNYAGNACSSNRADSSTSMDAWKSHTSWMQKSNENDPASQLKSRVKVSVPTLPPRPRYSNQRGNPIERQRRVRIAEKLNALQELLPHSAEGSQPSALDDVIDHIKYLQLQIKDLSQSRLGGESNSERFIFLEGYGHYISHQQMLNEPLEEMMGKMLEENPLAAAQLLESKGLLLMPMDLAHQLC